MNFLAQLRRHKQVIDPKKLKVMGELGKLAWGIRNADVVTRGVV